MPTSDRPSHSDPRRPAAATAVAAGALGALALLATACTSGADPLGDRRAGRTTASAREEFRSEQLEQIDAGLRGPPSPATWPGLWWNATLLGVHASSQRERVRDSLQRALSRFEGQPVEFRRATLRTIHAMFGSTFDGPVQDWLARETDPHAFAIGAHHLLSHDTGRAENLLAMLDAQFDDERGEPRLTALRRRLARELEPESAPTPPLLDLLAASELRGHPVVFSVQRTDRSWPGLTVVRRSNGRFVRDEQSGDFLHLPHLTLSSTNLPGTLTYGNTPEGVYCIHGSGIPTNEFIGPTRYLHSRLPIEATVTEFFHGVPPGGASNPTDAPSWSESLYASLLPASWRAHLPMREAWLAGRAGRSEILLHGTTIDPEAYSDRPFHPMTPSAGCLTAMEIWDEDGRLHYSDQRLLLEAWQRAGGPDGYLVVAIVNDRRGPVTIDELRATLRAAEAAAD